MDESGQRAGVSVGVEATLLGLSLVALAVLGLSDVPNAYLLFHTLVELFSVMVAVGTFMVAWNARGFAENGYVMLVGLAGVFYASIDLIHMLTYKGMSLLPITGADVPTQLWLAGRYLQAATLVAAPFVIRRRVRAGVVMPVYGVATAGLLASILLLPVFPTAYVDGTGLTPFKHGSELVIIAMLAVALLLLLRRRDALETRVAVVLAASIVALALAEAAFTMYVSVYGAANLVGHLLRVVAAYGFYRALVVTALTRPHELLYRDLKRSEAALRENDARLRRAKLLSDALNEIDAEMASSLDTDVILTRVVRRAAEVMGVEAVNVAVRERGGWYQRHWYGFDRGESGMTVTDAGLPIHMEAERTGRPVVVQDVATDPLAASGATASFGIASYLAVPLMSKDEVSGVLGFAKLHEPAPFSEEQVEFATRLAATLSLALENARLYEVEHRIADTLQEALVSLPREVPGLEFGDLYHSATEAARVGGDFYELFGVRRGVVGIVVGDVSGKGIEAAAMTATVKTAIKAFATGGDPPSVVVERVNDFLGRHTLESMFATLFFGTLDVETGRLTYCNAGHPPAVLRHLDGTASLLACSSPLVGAFEGMGYRDEETQLAPGDVLVLYTDGVIEARGGEGLYGEERLVRLVASAKAPAAELPLLIVGDVERHTGGTLGDDIAVLAVALARAAS